MGVVRVARSIGGSGRWAGGSKSFLSTRTAAAAVGTR